MKRHLISLLGCLAAINLAATDVAAAGLHVVGRVETDMTLGATDDLHVTAAGDAIAEGVTVDLADPGCRLFFDNIRPADVRSMYSGSITVAGARLEPETNARICVYRHGTEILPHGRSYTPLTAYGRAGLSGDMEAYAPGYHYSNSPAPGVETANIKPLALDDRMHSLRLARGYMATLATNPDGTGYSRCFIAEDADLVLDRLPAELDGKVSYVRVFLWQRPSKKGWVGGNNKINPPEGYFDQQCDLTGSTWGYTWGTSADWCSSPDTRGKIRYNQECVPEKWGAGGDWHELLNDMRSSHLLSYNEPDHGEQSAVSVEKAIEEWPAHLMTGMRLGSPATTDFSWLYRFMDACRERNYRVDYVAIHAYWGGSGSSVQVGSVDDWYRHLREVHVKTGRPLWITEWNNGANWTHEAWPADKAARQEKQRKFMEEVLAMMDTCSFIERYSVYNWVEEKRALFWGDMNLTPAGKVYRDFKAAPAFSRECEVVPSWEIQSAPALGLGYGGTRAVSLRWTDDNAEQVSGYAVERRHGDGGWTRAAELPMRAAEWSETLPRGATGDTGYRVVSLDGGSRAAVSAERSASTLAGGSGPIVGRRAMERGEMLTFLPAGYGDSPVFVAGVQTYRMKSPMLVAARPYGADAVGFGPEVWGYNATTTFVSRDTVSYMILPRAGVCRLGDLDAEAGRIDGLRAGDTRHVALAAGYKSAPAVFATVEGDSRAVAVVSGVGPDGFDVTVMREAGSPSESPVSVGYVAVATGCTTLGGREIRVGRTDTFTVGTTSARSARVAYGADMGEACFMASLSPAVPTDAAFTLRARSVSGTAADIFVSCEESVPGTRPAEVAGSLAWCAVAGESSSAGAADAAADVAGGMTYDRAGGVLRRADGREMTALTVCGADGRAVFSAGSRARVSTAGWHPGLYIASAAGCRPLRFQVAAR